MLKAGTPRVKAPRISGIIRQFIVRLRPAYGTTHAHTSQALETIKWNRLLVNLEMLKMLNGSTDLMKTFRIRQF